MYRVINYWMTDVELFTKHDRQSDTSSDRAIVEIGQYSIQTSRPRIYDFVVVIEDELHLLN